jgi:hypothetical protein
MQDAYGGLVNIFLLVTFLIVIEGVFAIAVNYTKAFKMKNYVIASIEQYEGSETCFGTVGESACIKRIKEYAANIAYAPAELNCNASNQYKEVEGLFCWKESDNKSQENSATNKSYRIVTQVDIHFPIVSKLTGLSFFQVSGDTRMIRLN